MCPVVDDPGKIGVAAADRSSVPDSGPGAAGGAATPTPVEEAVGAAFGALSRLRGARIFHPRGVGYTAVVRVEEPQARYSGVPCSSGQASILRWFGSRARPGCRNR